MPPYSIAIIDDEEHVREGIALALHTRYAVTTFATAEEALSAFERESPDLILLDVGLPGINGIEALKIIKRDHPETVVVMITAYEDLETVISSMKLGAWDYQVKPLQMEGLLVTIENGLQTIALRKEIQALQEKSLRDNFPCFVAESEAIIDVVDLVKKVAQSPDTSILITGETGTGKELIAGAIHHRSPNFKGPLITVNCAAIPDELVESELFGYEKGAFSGADAKGKKGLVEEAAGGTLFLDEVGDLSPEAQAKLLRFLEAGEYYRVGGTRKMHVQTRVISATNKDLEGLVRQETFRQDLYYRLAVINIRVPALNRRREDILPIARNFLFEFGRKFGKKFTGLSTDAEKTLKSYNWEGNIRQLKNCLEKATLLGEPPLVTEHDLGLTRCLEREAHSPGTSGLPELRDQGIDLPELLEDTERNYMERALQLADNNETKAARLLRMSRDTFRYRRKKLLL
ncbi:MAG TPA: sigma-54 dependent transcriptional regulator [Desulfomicrobiaceae bacterium]|nr:sigma-54 dependent transcriptional regulator [Desulfomicrobiaceae bacterium]